LACWRDSGRSLDEKIRFLLSKVREGCYLLALDNLEDTLADDQTFQYAGLRTFMELCLGTPHALRVVATSRERVAVDASGLASIRFLDLEHGLPEPEAVALLRENDRDGRAGLRDA